MISVSRRGLSYNRYKSYLDVFIIKFITLLHTWLADSFRHHGPRAVPHPAASQQQPPLSQ